MSPRARLSIALWLGLMFAIVPNIGDSDALFLCVGSALAFPCHKLVNFRFSFFFYYWKKNSCKLNKYYPRLRNLNNFVIFGSFSF